MEKITTFGVRFLNGYKEDKKDTINIFKPNQELHDED